MIIAMMSMIFSVHLLLRRKQGMIIIYNIPPIFDDYGDENNYFVEFSPTMITKNDDVHMGSINSFMHVAHDKDVLCDSYIVNSIYDATESYYERWKHGLMDLNNIEFPSFCWNS
jgi:hypothetical protein